MNKRKIHLVWFALIMVVVNLGAAPAASLPALVDDNGFGYTWDLIPNSVPGRWTSIALPENKLVFTNVTGGWSTIPSANFLTGGMKFFDENASNMWVSVNGLVGFGSEQAEPDNTFIPYDPLPNSIVAGFWTDLTMAEDTTGGIYYRRFVGAERPSVCTSATGTAASTNECVIVQWDQVLEYGGDGRRNTFQIVLYDTGEVHLLFQDIQSAPEIATVGLEAGDGVYGAQVFYNDPAGVASGDEVVFYYPEPRLRHKARPIYQSGLLARNGGVLEHIYTVTVTNNGDSTSQTSEVYNAEVEYNFQPVGWEAEILLGDSNNDQIKDTGSIAQEQTLEVQIKVTTDQETAVVGDYLDARIVFTSQDGLRESETRIVAAYSAPFAQIVHNKDLYLRTMWEQHQVDRMINQAFTGTNMSLVHALGTSFFVAWEKAVNNSTDIEYAFVGAQGTNYPVVYKVTQNSTQPSIPQDLFPAVGVGPDGRPVYTYIRVEDDMDGDGIIFNVRLTILNSNGTSACPVLDFDDPLDPCNVKESITENTLPDDDPQGPIYENPRLAITSEGKYVITWTKSVEEGPVTSRKIEMAVVNPDGSMALGPVPVFEDLTNTYGYYEMALTKFNDTNILVAAVKRNETSGAYQVVFKIINSTNGSVVVAETVLGQAGNPPLPDAAQLPTGEGIIAWKNEQADISFAMIYSNGVVKAGLDPLIMPNSRPMQAVSVTSEPNGNGVLTWTDTEDDYLYYALVNKDGDILTPPMVIAEDVKGGPVLSSKLGFGNAFFEGKAFTYLPLLTR